MTTIQRARKLTSAILCISLMLGTVLSWETTAFAAPVATPMVDGGGSHTVALSSDGNVWTWGENSTGQLGDGGTTTRISPIQVQNINNAVAVAAGGRHTVALRGDGTVWAWGWNEMGALGDGTFEIRFNPVQTQNISGVMAISAGDFHTAALRNDGTVWAWGRNDFYQLGDGSTTNRNIPVQVQNLDNVIAVEVGGAHTVALRSDGTVWTWGNNDFGQLGNGAWDDSSAPVQVQGLNGVTAISAGAGYTMALRNDGTVWTWGMNASGQLGYETPKTLPPGVFSLSPDDDLSWLAVRGDSNVPAQVQNLDSVIAIEAGCNHATALRNDGTVWTWGNNQSGQLGDGTRADDRVAPAQVRNLANAIGITADCHHSVAIRNDGTVWSWGWNEHGQLGDGTLSLYRTTPVQVQGIGGTGYLNLNIQGAQLAPPSPITDVTTPGVAQPHNDISVIINETYVVDFDGQPPVIVESRTLVPIRGVFETLGFDVRWNEVAREATLERHDFTVVIAIGSSVFTTNGAAHTLDVPAQIIGGRTLVPLRAVLESVGYELSWDGGTQTVLIYSPAFSANNELLRMDALMRNVLIDGVETRMGFDAENAQYIIQNGEFEGFHSNIRTILEGYNFYLDGTRSNASAFRGYLTNDTSGIIEARSPRYSAVLQRDEDGGYANITFNQMLLIGYAPEEAFQIFEYEIFRLTNQERTSHGVPMFAWNDAIGRAARNHSQDMAINDMLGHTGSDGSDVSTRLRREGISGFNMAGENAFMSSGGATPASRVQGWMDSPGHRSNILNRSLTHIGVGSYFVEGGTGWRGGHTQKFASGSGIRSNEPRRPGQIQLYGQTQPETITANESPETITRQVDAAGFVSDDAAEMTLSAQPLQPTIVGRYVNSIIDLAQFESVVFRLETGELPDGLSLARESDTAVAIRGTPTRAGTFIFMISARVEGHDGFIPLAFFMEVHPN